jgi:hypothetical protein
MKKESLEERLKRILKRDKIITEEDFNRMKKEVKDKK